MVPQIIQFKIPGQGPADGGKQKLDVSFLDGQQQITGSAGLNRLLSLDHMLVIAQDCQLNKGVCLGKEVLLCFRLFRFRSLEFRPARLVEERDISQNEIKRGPRVECQGSVKVCGVYGFYGFRQDR